MKQKINYIQIISHFIATYFIMFSFQSFSWLYYVKLIELTEIHGVKYIMTNYEKHDITLEDITLFSFWPKVACLIGIVFAFVISIAISKLKKWSILNSFIVLIITYLLFRFDLLGWDYIRSYLSIGRFISDYQSKLIVNGLFLLLIGLIIFFSKWTNRIIEKRKVELKNCGTYPE